MKLRIVMATRGESPYLADAVTSVRSAAPAAELVIVAPAAKAAELKRAADRARVISESGSGLYSALNQGARAEGEWDTLTWLNDDDLLRAPGFGTLLPKGVTGISFGRVELIDGRGGRVGEIPVARRGEDIGPLIASGIMPLAQPGTVIAREAWERCGGIDDSYRLAGDLDFFARAVRAGVAFTYVSATVAAFRLRAGQLSKRSTEMAEETVRARGRLGGVMPSRAARWRFRWGNLGVYFERVRRQGFVSMQQLTDQTE